MITSCPATATPFTVCERDDRRVTVSVNFNVWKIDEVTFPTQAPSNGNDTLLLLLLDDGTTADPVPSWSNFTFALRAGGSLLLSRTTPPLPTARITARLFSTGEVEAEMNYAHCTVALYNEPCDTRGSKKDKG